MEFEFWWLIAAPIFFALGWFAARVDIRHVLHSGTSLPRAYFRGLNFLLADQHDKAIDAFVDVAKQDPETLELQYALGNLFRRRGEIERAIRVHQNVLQRPDLSAENRARAQFELGQDYLKAGLLDRAEDCFTQLSNNTQGEVDSAHSLRALLEIYQREKDWDKAIQTAQQLQNLGAGSYQKQIAQFYCEQAEDKLIRSEFDDAKHLLTQALASNRNNVRATILLGDVFAQMGETQAAQEIWLRVEQQSVPHVALVAQRLMQSYLAMGQAEAGLKLLHSYLDQTPSIDLVEVLFEATLNLHGAQAACEMVRTELKRSPTLLGLDKLLEAQIKTARQLAVQPSLQTGDQLSNPRQQIDDWELARTLVHSHTQKLARYQCTHCGFKARRFYWHCPGCSQWESYPPKRTEELTILN